jgi:hypothetical protein
MVMESNFSSAKIQISGGFSILNILSLIIVGFSSLWSFLILFLFALRYRQWINQDVSLILVLNTYVCIFFASIVSLSHRIETLIGDFDLFNSRERMMTLECRIRTIFLFISSAEVFNACALLAFFRFVCVVYPQKMILQRYSTQLMLILVTWFLSFIVGSVGGTVITPIVFLPEEYFCYIDFENLLRTLMLFLSIYPIPISILCISYIRVIIFIRQSSERVVAGAQQQMNRDVVVFRRTMLIVAILIMLVTPIILFLIMRFITGRFYPLGYRVIWFFVNISFLFLSIAFVLIIPKMKIIFINSKKKRTDYNSIQKRNDALK